jgi:SAM-dependent methyltransferase
MSAAARTVLVPRRTHAVSKRANSRETTEELALRCPVCGSAMDAVLGRNLPQHADELSCGNCLFEMRCEAGIWDALPPARKARYQRFIGEYESVRASEGRGGNNALYYAALPYQDLTARQPFQWRIRSRSFRYFEREILRSLERDRQRPLLVLDLGAGNGWLSYRLSLRGHFCVAVDLQVNEFDGLAAAAHYSALLPHPLTRFRAEIERLPFTDEQSDCVIFNASLHYSEDYARTLGEALRCLRAGGTLAVLDTPWYRREESGAAMVAERREDFTRRFGFPSDALASQEYLTDARLSALEAQLGIRWTVHRPWYGLRWAARPWIAKVKGRREPSSFRIYTAVKAS